MLRLPSKIVVWACFVAFFALLAAPSIARAEEPSQAHVAEAKKFFEAGLKLSQQGAYRDALAAFLEAKRLAPRPSVQMNVAQTERDLRDYAAAYDAYAELLARYASQLRAQDVQAAQRAMTELEVFTGTIDVKVSEPGARVTIDSADVGVTPLAHPLRYNIGAHAIAVTKDGFAPLSRSIDLRGRDAIVISDALVKTTQDPPPLGHVNVRVTPENGDATIVVDGKDVGAPPAQLDLPPGSHEISARAKGMSVVPQTIDVKPKETREVVIALTAPLVLPPPAPPPKEKREPNLPHEREDPWRGAYSLVRVSLGFQLNQPTNDVAERVNYTSDAAVATDGALDIGVDARFGYSFGPAGIELGIFGTYRHGQSTVNVSTATTDAFHPGPAPRVDDYSFKTLGGGLLLGGRFMPRMSPVRPTIGVAGGLGVMGAFFEENITSQSTGTSSYPSDPTFYLVPRLDADAGVLIGSTPGTKFYLGLKMIADFNPSSSTNVSSVVTSAALASAVQSGIFVIIPGNGQVRVVSGPEIFVGPVLGVAFGH